VTPEQYAALQTAIAVRVLTYIQRFARLFAGPILGRREWINLLTLIFPVVQQARDESSDLARQFYDSQREIYLPGEPPHDVLKQEYRFEWFVQDMEPARKKMSRPNSTDSAIAELAMFAVKQVENGGRRTIIEAVETDPGQVQGWARVATGRETCAFCLMLVSRGPVYLSADTAGLDIGDKTALEMIIGGEDISDLMRKWHPNCDCKVVPVFDRANWPGKDAADRALEAWKQYTLGYSGQDALNAFRRAVDGGQISDFRPYAGLSLAA